jgi:SAM-dependent methyltransferase
MVLNLGCGHAPMPGPAINHDRRRHSAYVDVVWNLNCCPWPWPDNGASEIHAIDLVEHLDDWTAFFDECWRILAPGGQLQVRVPRHDSPNVILDPTHKRGYCVANFDFLDPMTAWGAKAVVYSPYGWHKRSVTQDSGNITARLEPRK